MGEVYRARDTKLGRDVAVKILPEEFAGDPERLARFEREARALAAVNDPHIAHIYGLERQKGQDGREGRDGQEGRGGQAGREGQHRGPFLFIVMELVEGTAGADKS